MEKKLKNLSDSITLLHCYVELSSGKVKFT